MNWGGVNHPPPTGTKVNEKCRDSCTSTPFLFLHEILQAELYLFHFYHYVYVFTDSEKKQVAKNSDTPAVLLNDLMYVIF